MVSFDLESLFTNIPPKESIGLAVDYIFKNNQNLGLTKHELKKMFYFATAQTHFLVNDTFYDQADGTSMGSTLAPVLANPFMGHHEKIWLRNYDSDVLFCRYYVHDIFVCLIMKEMPNYSFVILTTNILTSDLLWRKRWTKNFLF